VHLELRRLPCQRV